jgi:hypothetical protein
VSVEELLDWIGNKLALEWITSESMVKSYAQTIIQDNINDIALMEIVSPPQDVLNDLLASVNIGHFKKINQKLDIIDNSNQEYKVFVERMRVLTAQFQIKEMKILLHEMTK